MSEYENVMAQIAELQTKAAELRATETKSAMAQIKELMEKYGITIADLQGRVAKPKKTPTVAPKYRDRVTGKEWSGRGREPNWIKGKNKDDFKIDSESE